MSSIQVREGVRLVVDRPTWPDGTPMLSLRYRTRTPAGGWTDGRAFAFPEALADAVAAALLEAPRPPRRPRGKGPLPEASPEPAGPVAQPVDEVAPLLDLAVRDEAISGAISKYLLDRDAEFVLPGPTEFVLPPEVTFVPCPTCGAWGTPAPVKPSSAEARRVRGTQGTETLGRPSPTKLDT